MSGVDVRDLAKEKLPAGKFPVDPRADFRLYITPEVHRGIEDHAKEDVSVEICGVLVGNWGTDENGPYAAVTNYIRCASAASKFAEVTFTHESWAQINKEMDSKYADARIIGWYHSHPDFGIFLSERDSFIQEHFFSSPGQVAYVIDPVRNLEGVFAWRDGKPKPMPHFWIGNTVRTVEASERIAGNGMATSAHSASAAAAQRIEPKSWDNSPLGMATIVLGVLALFGLGYLYGAWRAHAAEESIRQDAVARFADTELIRRTHEADMASVRNRLSAVAESLDKIPTVREQMSEAQVKEAALRRDAIKQHLKLAAQELGRLQLLTDSERAIYSRIIELKISQLSQIIEKMNAAQQKAREDKKATQSGVSTTNTPANRPQNKSSKSADKRPVTPPTEAPKAQPTAPAQPSTSSESPSTQE